jgi:hypothetical protein
MLQDMAGIIIHVACQILRRDKDAMKYAPKVMQGQMSGPEGSRSYSTSAILRQREQADATSSQSDPSVSVLANMIVEATQVAVESHSGLKFEMPVTPLPKTEHVKRRYDPLVEQFTKLLLQDGKLSAAQKVGGFGVFSNIAFGSSVPLSKGYCI